ncbi:hypothetical protein LEP1GSC062_2665 [Leptospira alexanderi serovar Manhao 3 str. L 60]|uniref:Uncharacterized protein n=1 Tax=Leptospira alexanderi serovar Manhao 3 str. L 60 TaxID=1049759 RepID=V6HUY6_9LEPT|nr:hypothetical protein LEP1GSC062_2665 [Leptospira alexanderi serovar Manhao 3 str. L 60]
MLPISTKIVLYRIQSVNPVLKRKSSKTSILHFLIVKQKIVLVKNKNYHLPQL